jgi:hypothetical protein
LDSGEEIDLSQEQRAIRTRLAETREEHRALDAALVALANSAQLDTLQLARLKKRKLALKDEITWLEDQITPDIIA